MIISDCNMSRHPFEALKEIQEELRWRRIERRRMEDAARMVRYSY
jgi:hypothetical protein